jgi:hypothetical protein
MSATKKTFTDADFFRRVVSLSAAEVFTRTNIAVVVEDICDLANAITRPRDNFRNAKARRKYYDTQTERLIHIAALCERAAVDITIPASRISKKGRDRRSARSASKPTATRKGARQ